VFLALLLLLRDLLMLGYRLKEVNWWLLALLGDLFLLRLIPGYFRVPRCLFELDLFTPFQNGLFFLESRGDVLFTVVLILFFAYWFFKLFVFSHDQAGNSSTTTTSHYPKPGDDWMVHFHSVVFLLGLAGEVY
jgi:hypothetical protein